MIGVRKMTQASSRRRFLQAGATLAGLGLLSGCSSLPSLVQPAPRLRRIGYLAEIPAPPSGTHSGIEALRQGLHELGWIEGQNYVIEFRWAAGNRERLAELATELVHLGVDLIYTVTTPEATAARRATTTIPIVAASPGDPVMVGLAASFARPGGNVTGLASIDHELNGKRIELLKTCVPGMTRLAALRSLLGRGQPAYEAHMQAIEAGAQALAIQVLYAEADEPSQFADAISQIVGQHPEALFVTPGAINNSNARADRRDSDQASPAGHRCHRELPEKRSASGLRHQCR